MYAHGDACPIAAFPPLSLDNGHANPRAFERHPFPGLAGTF